jgi:hypothetical protein
LGETKAVYKYLLSGNIPRRVHNINVRKRRFLRFSKATRTITTIINKNSTVRFGYLYLFDYYSNSFYTDKTMDYYMNKWVKKFEYAFSYDFEFEPLKSSIIYVLEYFHFFIQYDFDEFYRKKTFVFT